jgi:hypothetical protein
MQKKIKQIGRRKGRRKHIIFLGKETKMKEKS